MTDTRIDFLTGPDWTSEKHSTYSVRYLNGRKIHVITSIDFMTAEMPVTGNKIYWAVMTQFSSLEGARGKKFGFTYRTSQMSGPSLMERAMQDLIPDDNQGVPF
jgi:hypothetical protein